MPDELARMHVRNPLTSDPFPDQRRHAMRDDTSQAMTGQQAPEQRSAPLPSAERIQDLLFDAARLGRDDVIPALLQAGADIAATDAKGHTAFILAAYHDHRSTALLLLDHGADIDQGDEARGNTALMGVAFKGFAGLASQLLASGANPHAVNKAGQTALMMAALFNHGEIVDCLLARGADPHQPDAVGNSAISVAVSQGNEAMKARLEAAVVQSASGD